jgi:RimJ/RimL family protein N-acetyltransferase
MKDSDTELLVRWRSDPEIKKWMFSQEEISRSSHLEWFHTRQNRIDYVICLKEGCRPIGAVNFKNIDNATNRAEAGKMIGDKSQWGKGYATEAFGMWLHFGFEHLGFQWIYIRTLSSNSANIAVNQRLGFEICCTERDVRIQPEKVVDIVTMQVKDTQYSASSSIRPNDIRIGFSSYAVGK